jgi:tetratricopeptide (TPR) repeat protein
MSLEENKSTKEPVVSDSITREQLERLQTLSEGPRTPHSAHHIHSPLGGAGGDDTSSIVSDGSLQTQRLHMELNLRAMQELATRHIQNLELDDAVEVWEEILRGQVQIYGYWHPRVGTVLHNLSLVHSLNKAYDHSAFIGTKAIDVRLSTLGDMHLDLAESFAHLGLMRVELNECDLAVQAFEAALEIRRHCLQPHDPKISRLLNNIGCAYYEIGQFDKAMTVFKEALEIQRFLMKTSAPALLEDTGINSVGRVLLSIAATLINVASIYLKWNDYDQSIAAVEEALLLQASVLHEDDERVLDCRELLAFVENERSSQVVQSRSLFVRFSYPFTKPSCC